VSSPKDNTSKYLKDSQEAKEAKASNTKSSSSWTNEGLTGKVDPKSSGRTPQEQLFSEVAHQVMSGGNDSYSQHSEVEEQTTRGKKSVRFTDTQSQRETYTAEEYDRESIIKRKDIPKKKTEEAEEGVKKFSTVYNEIKKLRDKFDTKRLIEHTGMESEEIDNLENEFNSAHQRYNSAVEISKSAAASTDKRKKNASYVPFYELMKVIDKAENIQERLERAVEELKKQEQQALPDETKS